VKRKEWAQVLPQNLKSGKICSLLPFQASAVMCSFMPDFRLIGIKRKYGTPHHTIHFMYAKFGPIIEGVWESPKFKMWPNLHFIDLQV